MNKQIIEHLRRFSSVPGKERTWVSELSDDRLFELYLKIRSGQNARAIARHAQTVWKVGQKSSIHSISQGVLKFKQRISHLLPPVPSSGPDEISTSVFPLPSEENSTLETMENIARQYEGRIQKMIGEEKETGVRYPFINRDLQALANLRKTILKQTEWGRTHEDPLNRKRYERMKQTMDRRFNSLLENIGEDGQDRLIRAANRFLELAEQKAVPARQKEDGTYELIASNEST